MVAVFPFDGTEFLFNIIQYINYPGIYYRHFLSIFYCNWRFIMVLGMINFRMLYNVREIWQTSFRMSYFARDV